MVRRKVIASVLGLSGLLLARSDARAAIHVVDDDNVPCFGAPYRTINEALAVAEAGDEIQVCPGLYSEQVVLTKPLTLLGKPVGSQKVVIRPPALLASRQSTMGGKPVTAGILVDARRVVLDSVVLDMSVANAVGCAPMIAGIYLRAASGAVSNVAVSGARAVAPPDCDTGVGLLIEGGQIGDVFGKPLLGRAVVAVSGSRFVGNQKGGIAVLGPRAAVRIGDSQVLGDGAAALNVQNGIELSAGVKARLQNVQVRDLQTAVPGKTAAGVLLFGSGKVRVRASTLTAVQSGVFVVGNAARVLGTQLGDVSSDAIVFLGQKNRAAGNLIDSSSVSGVFIDGDRNTVRAGNMSNMPVGAVGVWFFDGDRNVAKGIEFNNVPERERVGGVRSLTAAAADPLTLDCATDADCADGNPCTVDACDVITGACSFTNVADTTSCTDGDACSGDEVCLGGVCQAGIPLVCVDGNLCTSDSCDSVLGCQYTPVLDGTSCEDIDVCNGVEQCLAGSCQPGVPLVCVDGNECTSDACDFILGCQYTALANGIPCTGGTCQDLPPPTCVP